MTELTQVDLYRMALKARDAADEQFVAAVPGWPDNVKVPVGAAGMNALQVLVQREREVQEARTALLESTRQS